MNDCMVREKNKTTVILALWAALGVCVVVGSLLPAASPAMVALGRRATSSLPTAQASVAGCCQPFRRVR